MTPHPLTRDVLMIGGGHAHALVLRRWGMNRQAGTRLTVVNPGPTAPYTGMLPGHVAGHYGRDDLDIDLVRLCRFAGAALIDGAVDGIEAGRAHVAGRGWLPFDVASIDVGIHAEMPEIPGFAEHGIGAKPLGRFAARWRAHLAAVRDGTAGDAAVIGGGVAGVELALAMAHALRGSGAQVTVIEAEAQLTGMGDRARRLLRAAMRDLGVGLRLDATVRAVDAESVVLSDGTVPSVFTTGAAGARPHAWIADTDLPLENGFIRVTPRLQVEGRPDLFAAGDCAHMVHAPRPKAGVFAVRQAPVLHDNLRAALSGDAMRRFEPQKSYLKLISLGGKAALAEKAGITLSGGWLWRAKDKIDRDFMAKLTDLPAMPAPVRPKGAARGDGEMAQPLCGGCGAKVGAGALSRALATLPPTAREDVLSRPGDDAAVLVHGAGRQVLTTDHLRAFTGDLERMARIATVHALGDVWAMGAQPQAAMVQLILPRMSEAMQDRSLAQLLPAIEGVLRAAGADLVGGHTTMGAEMSIGLSITGLTDRPIGLDGARAGDALILTRPLGTGIVLAAEMAAAAPGRAVLDMLDVMATPQGDAAAILEDAHAMTDVTGFGLAGHVGNICSASGVSARLMLDALPVYEAALDLAAAGHASTLAPSNAAAAQVEGPDDPRRALLFDPQTAGGLLAAVPAAAADGLLDRLREAGHPAARIGGLETGSGLRAL